MLVLDSTIGCIEADESQVLVLFRSAPAVMTLAPGSRPASMEAYICATQEKSQTKVHLALVADNRRIYVYLEALKLNDASGIERSIQQAVSCAKEMGFRPELVDLSYRPAMREVVLRNIKILRLPGSKWVASLRPGLPGAPLLPVQSPAGTVEKIVLPSPGKTAETTPPPETSAAPRATVIPPAVKAPLPAAPATADAPGLSRGERSSVSMLQLQKELQMMAAERDALLAQLQQLSAVHQEVVMELSVQRDEAARVTAETSRLARAQKEMKEAATERESLLSEFQELGAKLKESQLHAEEVKGELSTLTRQLAAAKEGNRELIGQLTAAKDDHKELAGQLAAAKDENKELAGQLAAAKDENKDLGAQLVAAKDEAKTLLAERKGLLKKGEASAAQHAKVMEENRALDRELAELRAERDAESGRMSSLEQDLYTLASELGTATAEVEAVRAELSSAVTRIATAEAELVVTRGKVVAAESKGAAIWKKLKATELELEAARAESAATVGTLPPAAPAPQPTVSSAAPPAKAGGGSADAGEPAAEESRDLASTPGTEPSPIEFEEPPALVQKQAPVQGKRSVGAEASGMIPQEPVRNKQNEPQAAPSAHEQAPEMAGSEANAPESHAAELRDPQAVQDLNEGSWYGLKAESGAGFQDVPAPSAGTPPTPTDAASAPPKVHEFLPFGDLQESFFSSEDDSAPVEQFVLRPDLKVIEYLHAEDVVELHQSINNANMAPDGKGQESCRGYICALKCGDKLQVFAAIYGTRTGRTSVYAPATQPLDEAGYASAMRSAITFAEEVGLMMEPVKGGATALQVDCIVQCPVLKKAA